MPCEQHGPSCDGGCIDPNVDNGMMTKVWGPAGWLFLHSVTFGYPYAYNPDNPKHIGKPEDYYNFFYYLGKVMPCRYCRESYMQFFQEDDPAKHLKTRDGLVKWLYDLHNKVNHKLGVPKCDVPSLAEVQKQYESYRAKCKPTTNEEREENQKKGCTIPADGTPRRSVLKVVQYEKGDVTRRDNAHSSLVNETSEDYMVMRKTTIFWVMAVVFMVMAVMVSLM